MRFINRFQSAAWRKRAAWRIVRAAAIAGLVFIVLDCLFPFRPEIEYAPLVRARDGQVIHAFLTRDQQWRFRAELGEITPELAQAIVFKEDKSFYRHPGVNPLAVARAAFGNLFHLRRTSGASTITMQVARMLAPKRRSYANKIVEMFRALQLEAHYSKAGILQLYLNLVPYGSNIQGVKAASLLYFNKSPDQLSLAEITALSIIPNRPNSMVMGRDNARIVTGRNQWLQRFSDAGLFPPATIRDALAEPLTATRHDAPDAAPQLSWRLRFAHPGDLELLSPIDAKMQLQAEQIVHNYVQTLRLQNVYNAAALIVDNRTGAVCVYIGSPDFADRAHQGQVDGVKALRSPGSTLKPFLYGLAFDAGIATPQTVVNDVPINLAGYTPENYDLQFRGPVTVEDALRMSLNIPAVKTLQKLGVPQFTQSLGAAGFLSVWQQRKKVGLSMILGGCTVRLEELTALFSAFANDGVMRPLQWGAVALPASPLPLPKEGGTTSRFHLWPFSENSLHPLLRSNQMIPSEGGGAYEPVSSTASSSRMTLTGPVHPSPPPSEGAGGRLDGLGIWPAGEETGFRILSPSANYMVCHTLCELTRPDMPNLSDATRSMPRIAWKTGTSYGRKDAWSVGFNAHYTIGVWLGNFDGRGVTALSGAATATPLLFQLFNAIDPHAGDEWLTAPAELATRFVCRTSGLLPGDSCTDQVMDYYIPGISSVQRCAHQRAVWVSADGAFSYCTSCLPAAGYAIRIYPDIAPELAAFYDSRNISYRRIPPHNPACSRLFDGQPPVINTLQPGMTYIILDRGKQGLQLGCSAASDVQRVYWYINDKFYRAAGAGEKLFFNPEGATVKISCTDDKGRVTDMEVKLKYL